MVKPASEAPGAVRIGGSPMRKGKKGKKRTRNVPRLCPQWSKLNPPNCVEKNGGDDGTRTRDLCRDRRLFNGRTMQNQPFTDAMYGNSRHGLAYSEGFCAPLVHRLCNAPT